jgi:hypothetical protein
MLKRRLMRITMLATVALLISATTALADDNPPGNGDVTRFGEDYTVESGETVTGDVTVFGGSVTVEAGGTVEGSVVVWGGDAEISGTVEGDVVVSSGTIYLDEGARVKGNIVCSWDCNLEKDTAARVGGDVIEGVPIPRIKTPITPIVPEVYYTGPQTVLNTMINIVSSMVSVVLIAALGGLVALIWPEQVERVGDTIREHPWPTFGYGLLTAFAGGALTLVLILTLCLSPIGLVTGLVLFALGLLGWICVGTLLGNLLFKAFNATEIAPIWAAGLDTLIITAIVAIVDTGLGTLACLWCLKPLIWTVAFIVGCAGLGAVVLTRFGTQVYPPTSYASSAPVETPESSEPIE